MLAATMAIALGAELGVQTNWQDLHRELNAPQQLVQQVERPLPYPEYCQVNPDDKDLCK